MPKHRTVAKGFSSDQRMARCDKRTRLGRYMSKVEKDLNAHVGGSPTVAQRLLISSIVTKAGRLMAVNEQLLSPGSAPSLDRHALGWMNAMTRDLEKLGFDQTKPTPPTLEQYVASRSAGNAA